LSGFFVLCRFVK